MDIAEVARRSGVTASTLRFYEEKKLIASVGRSGLRRTFDPRVLERLALIALGRSAGFSLDEIARMFAADGRPKIDRGALAAKAGPTLAMLTRFQSEWFDDSVKWVDSVLKIAAAESPANKAQLQQWLTH